MYTNIPQDEVPQIIQYTLENSHTTYDTFITEIQNLLHVILEQNYFQFNNRFYIPTNDLAMGARTSALLAEIFLQYMDYNKIYTVLHTNNIIRYYRYVDSILICIMNNTDTDKTLADFNNVHPKLQFTLQKERNSHINFLDITIHRTDSAFEYNIYRKHTAASHIIHNSSCHPPEHKTMAIRYFIHRLITYPLSETAQKCEIQTITYILQDNDYYIQQLNVIQNQTIHEEAHQNKKNNTVSSKKNWTLFTYSHRKVKTITKLLKQSSLSIAFKMTKTIKNILNTQPKPNIYHNSGIYQLQCQRCFHKYIGQTGRTFHARYTEHIQDIRNNRGNARFSHIS
jgi:hypothetical protein